MILDRIYNRIVKMLTDTSTGASYTGIEDSIVPLYKLTDEDRAMLAADGQPEVEEVSELEELIKHIDLNDPHRIIYETVVQNTLHARDENLQ